MTQSATNARPAALAVYPLGSHLRLLVWDAAAANSRRLRVRVDGAAARPPFVHLDLPLDARRHRNVFALAVRTKASPQPDIEIADGDGMLLARTIRDAHLPPAAEELDAPSLVAGLGAAARARLARFLLEVCGSLFRVSNDGAFVAGARSILSEIGTGSGRLTPRCRLTDGYVFYEGLAPAGLGERLSAVVLSADGVHRLGVPPALLPMAQPRGALQALGTVLPASLIGRGSVIVVFGEHGLICRRLSRLDPTLPNAYDWLTQANIPSSRHRRFLLDCLAYPELAGEDLLRELQLLTPACGRSGSQGQGDVLRATAELIVACPDGVFFRGRIDDPQRLVAAIAAERGDSARRVDVADLAWLDPDHRSDGDGALGRRCGRGFALYLPQWTAAAAAPVRLSLALRSGTCIAFGEGPTLLAAEPAYQAVLATVSAGGPDNPRLVDRLAPAVAALHRERLAQPRRLDGVAFGTVPPEPTTSLLVPLGTDGELLRCRLGLFAADPAMARVEVIYLAGSDETAAITPARLADLHAGYGLAARLITVDRPLPAVALLNIGVAAARAPLLAVLGADAIPEAAGWLDTLAGFLTSRPTRGLAGGQALYEDHSLVAAGIEVEADGAAAWSLRPLFAGFPRDFAPASVPAPSAAVAADCFVLRRSLLVAAGGFAKDYLLAESAVADLCFKVRAGGFEVWQLPVPAVFRLGRRDAPATPENAAGELDRQLLEQRWRAAMATAAAWPPGRAARPPRPMPADAMPLATQKAA